MRRGETMSFRLSLGTLFLTLAMVATGCTAPGGRGGLPIEHNLPPAQMLMHPGPGVGGPGPGVLAPMRPPGMVPMSAPTVQVWFTDPESCEVKWDVAQVGQYDSSAHVVPFKQSFAQGGVYRLKISSIEGFEDKTLYPSLEVGPITPRTSAFVAHSAIPIQFTNEDFTQVTTGNFVTKVIYIPDPEFQELAIAGIDTLVSTRLDPGVDPIVEADRRGSILAIVRMGNKDLEGAAAAGSNVQQASHFDSYNDKLMRQAGMNQPGGMGMGGMPPRGMGGMPPRGMGGMPPRGMGGMPPGAMGPGGSPAPFGRSMSPNYVSGVTAPEYGMPITATPIGLPGPPHIPLGVPAGLQKHTMRNHTAVQIPQPTKRLSMHVKQSPGISYPRPADRVMIRETTVRPRHRNRQHPANMQYGTRSTGGDEGCINCTIGD